MLTLTPAANAALVAIIESPEVPEGAAIRLDHATGPDGEPALGMMVVSEAEATDEVIETPSGVEVFVSPDAAEALDDQELDADVEGDQLSFSIQPQNWNSGPPGTPQAGA